MGFGLLYDTLLLILASGKQTVPIKCFDSFVYWQAVNNLMAQPHLPELAKYRLSAKEWEVLQDFEVILSVITVTSPFLHLD